MLEQFRKKHPHSGGEWGESFPYYSSGYRDGRESVYKSLDREALEDMIKDLDWKEQTEEQERLRSA